jgi:glycosyltransferase involved in cell wall biosynthesis
VKAPEIMVQVIEKVLSQRDDVIFDWVGVDTMDGQVQKSLFRYRERVNIRGKMPHDELLDLHDKAHVYVHTSHYESQCVALCEAAAAGVPIVSTSVGIASQIDGAIIHDTGDVDGISSSINLLLDDRTRASNLSQQVYQWAKTYNAEWTTAAFEEIYYDVLEHSPKGER